MSKENGARHFKIELEIYEDRTGKVTVSESGVTNKFVADVPEGLLGVREGLRMAGNQVREYHRIKQRTLDLRAKHEARKIAKAAEAEAAILARIKAQHVSANAVPSSAEPDSERFPFGDLAAAVVDSEFDEVKPLGPVEVTALTQHHAEILAEDDWQRRKADILHVCKFEAGLDEDWTAPEDHAAGVLADLPPVSRQIMEEDVPAAPKRRIRRPRKIGGGDGN